MKILVVCQHFYPEQFRINDICCELVKKGHRVTVLTGLPNYPKGKVLREYKWFKNRKQIINGVCIVRCSLIGRRSSAVMMGINYLWFLIAGCLKALFMKKDFDIVYSYQLSPITMAWPAIVVKKLKGIPLVLHCLDQWPISLTTGPFHKNSMAYTFFYKLSVWTYKKADLITVSSNSFKKYFEDELNIRAEEKGLIYFPSYAESDYANVGDIDNDLFDVVFAGNIGPAQSVETIVEAANILKDFSKVKFHIIGDGLSRKFCEQLAGTYGLSNVDFYGSYPVSEMPRFYKLADAFIITMVDNEVVNSTLPAKIQSYMLAGKPIIGAINGEVRDVVMEADCGKCCESGNYEKLAKIIVEVYNDKERLINWGGNSLRFYKDHFEKDKCIQDLEDILENTIRRR